MAAEEMTETTYDVVPNLNSEIIKFKFTGATDADWVIFPEPIGSVKATLPTGGDAATVYATADVATLDWTASVATGAYDIATANQIPASGYMMVGTEIIKYSGVTKADTSGTFTLDKRACFGTTAAIHAVNAKVYILNTVVFTLGTVGLVRGVADVIGE